MPPSGAHRWKNEPKRTCTRCGAEHYGKGLCFKCYMDDYLPRYRAEHGERLNKERKERYHNDPEYKEHLKDTKYKSQFGISLEDYNRMLESQNNLCAICKQPETETNTRGGKGKIVALAVDHNHETGQVRGLLCGKCNRAVGNLRDSILIAESLVEYLEKHEGQEAKQDWLKEEC